MLKLSGIKSNFDFITGSRVTSEVNINEKHKMRLINSKLSLIFHKIKDR